MNPIRLDGGTYPSWKVRAPLKTGHLSSPQGTDGVRSDVPRTESLRPWTERDQVTRGTITSPLR